MCNIAGCIGFMLAYPAFHMFTKFSKKNLSQRIIFFLESRLQNCKLQGMKKKYNKKTKQMYWSDNENNETWISDDDFQHLCIQVEKLKKNKSKTKLK